MGVVHSSGPEEYASNTEEEAGHAGYGDEHDHRNTQHDAVDETNPHSQQGDWRSHLHNHLSTQHSSQSHAASGESCNNDSNDDHGSNDNQSEPVTTEKKEIADIKRELDESATTINDARTELNSEAKQAIQKKMVQAAKEAVDHATHQTKNVAEGHGVAGNVA